MWTKTLVGAALLAVLGTGPLHASPTQCDTKIDGEPVTIFYDTADPTFSSFRERFLRRGHQCPGAVVITYLMPDLSAAEREVFCANYDPLTQSHSMPAQGRRDNFGRCVEPSKTCKLVNTTKQEAMTLMGVGRQAEDGMRPSLLSSTVSAVTHSSGAMILSGNAGALTGILSSVGTGVGAAVSAPAVLVGAAASVVVIGGAVYLCSDED
ncbi:hypothetical protein [Roseinatronobacter monicus]|uniref:hypothetical protein n=1 Tax=Roseinatronobacter monicus TaxID=393481 RepID=UPI003F3856F2